MARDVVRWVGAAMAVTTILGFTPLGCGSSGKTSSMLAWRERCGRSPWPTFRCTVPTVILKSRRRRTPDFGWKFQRCKNDCLEKSGCPWDS